MIPVPMGDNGQVNLTDSPALKKWFQPVLPQLFLVRTAAIYQNYPVLCANADAIPLARIQNRHLQAADCGRAQKKQ